MVELVYSGKEQHCRSQHCSAQETGQIAEVRISGRRLLYPDRRSGVREDRFFAEESQDLKNLNDYNYNKAVAHGCDESEHRSQA